MITMAHNTNSSRKMIIKKAKQKTHQSIPFLSMTFALTDSSKLLNQSLYRDSSRWW